MTRRGIGYYSPLDPSLLYSRYIYSRFIITLSKLFVEKEKEARYSDGDNLTTR